MRNSGDVTGPIMVQTGRDRDNSSDSLTLRDQPSGLSISTETIPNSDSTTVQDSDSDIVSFYTAKSSDEPGMQDESHSAPPSGIPLSVRPPSVPHDFPGASELAIPVHASSSVETV